MNKTILILTMTGLITIALASFGKSPTTKIAESKKVFSLSVSDTSSEYQKFKKEADVKMKQFDNDIAKLKAKAKNENKAIQDKYNKDVIALEQKNNEMKKQLEKDKQMDKAKLKSFEQDFNKSMDDLGKSIKDLFTTSK
jgi:parvulin-like peptidyl-prolyl isomerase